MWGVCPSETILCVISCVMQQTGVTDVIIAAPFTGSVWALSVLVTEVSHRKMEELFEMSFSVTATLLICVWAGGSESQRQSEPKKKKRRLPYTSREVCSQHSSCEGG